MNEKLSLDLTIRLSLISKEKAKFTIVEEQFFSV